MKRIRSALIVVFILFLGSPRAYSLPQVDQIISGSAEISNPSNSTLQINAADKTIINFKSFDIGENESVVINLPSSNKEILNRVISGQYSSILGKLISNGIVFLVNENGLRFGPRSFVDVARLVASTRNITDNDFLKSNYVFSRSSTKDDRLLLNQGRINAKKGPAVLIAGAIENAGTITCAQGNAALAAGDSVRVIFPANGFDLSIIIDKETAHTVLDYNGKPITDQIKNTGTINAKSGSILLKAEALTDLFAHAINLNGFVIAKGISSKDGSILLAGNNDIINKSKAEARDITLNSGGDIVNDGSLKADRNLSLKAKGAINSSGIIKAKNLNEEGASLRLGGTVNIQNAYTSNADGAVTFYTGNYKGTYTDPGDINIAANAIINLTGNTTFKPLLAFKMGSGSSIDGKNKYNLSLYASRSSILDRIFGIRTLGFFRNGGSPTYNANYIITANSVAISGSTLNMNHKDLRTNVIAKFSNGILRGANYYVDSKNGSDSQAGTYLEKPWKSFKNVNKTPFQPGDTIKFARGGVWREQLKVSGSGDSTGDVTYTAYGSGNLPKILGSVSVKNTGTMYWVATGDENVWKYVNKTFNEDVGNLIFNNEESFGTKWFSLATLMNKKQQGGFFRDKVSKNLFMYSTSNPNILYSKIEAALNHDIVKIEDKRYVTVERLDLRYGGAHGIGVYGSVFSDGTFWDPHHITIQDNYIAYIGGGLQNPESPTSTTRLGNGIQFWDNAHDTWVRRNNIYNIYDAGITTQGTGSGNKKYNQYFSNNTMVNCEFGFEFFNNNDANRNTVTHDIFVDYNTITNSGMGWGHTQRIRKGTALYFGEESDNLTNFYVRNNVLDTATETLILFTTTANYLNKIFFDNNTYIVHSGRLSPTTDRGYLFAIGEPVKPTTQPDTRYTGPVDFQTFYKLEQFESVWQGIYGKDPNGSARYE